jgi:hypothetical protein
VEKGDIKSRLCLLVGDLGSPFDSSASANSFVLIVSAVATLTLNWECPILRPTTALQPASFTDSE